MKHLNNGLPQYKTPNNIKFKTLEPGSYFGSKNGGVHKISSSPDKESILYVRSNGKFDVISD